MLMNRVARRGGRLDLPKTQAKSPNKVTNSEASDSVTKRILALLRKPCHFLRLPAELRNVLYRLVIDQHPDQSTILRVRTIHANSRRYWPTPLQPALSRTARRVRYEVLSMFYGQRTFVIRARRLVRDGLLDTWSRMMRPSLFHLRSIKFRLRSPNRKFEVDITVRVMDDGTLQCAFDDHGREMCTCKFLRCARDVEHGIIGSKIDAPLVRFLKAWDMPAPGLRGESYAHCGFCGKENLYVSLGGDQEAESDCSGSESECSGSDESGSRRC